MLARLISISVLLSLRVSASVVEVSELSTLLSSSSTSSSAAALAAKVRGEQRLQQVKSSMCGFGTFNISSLTKPTGAADWIYGPIPSNQSTPHNTWYINVCANTNQPCLGDSSLSPGVWNYDYQQPYACFNLGSLDTATWFVGLSYFGVKYSKGDTCYNAQPARPYTLEERFTCDPTTPGSLDGVTFGATACDYVASFRSSAACLSTPTPTTSPVAPTQSPTIAPTTAPAVDATTQANTILYSVAASVGSTVILLALYNYRTRLGCGGSSGASDYQSMQLNS